MLVSCPACSARHDLDDLAHEAPASGSRTLRLECPECATVWLVPSKYADHRNPASSLPPPAVERAQGAARRRTTERNQRDLFAPPPSDFGLARPKTSEPPVPIGGYGARNENSVLFTVEEIRNSARPPAPSPEHAGAHGEQEEGVIDLQALTLGKSQGVPALPVFGVESAPDAFSSEIAGLGASGERGARRLGRFTTKQIAIAAGAAAAALLCVVGLFVVFRGEQPDMSHATSSLAATASTTEATAAPPATPPPAQTSEPAKPAEETVATTMAASDAPATTDEGAAAEKPGKHKGKHHGKAAKPHAKPAKKAKAAAPAKSATPKAKKSDACGCHGDFECTLRCAAKGK